jgi:hypothetical protein
VPKASDARKIRDSFNQATDDRTLLVPVRLTALLDPYKPFSKLWSFRLTVLFVKEPKSEYLIM